MDKYQPRSIARLPDETRGEWCLKRYSIVYGPSPFDAERFAGSRALITSCLPSPARIAGRPGIGFMIDHQGRNVDYAVLAWWDRENELPIRVFVRDAGSEVWRAAVGSESVCVWDLQVIWAERQLYVRTVLGPEEAGGLDAYRSASALEALQDAT